MILCEINYFHSLPHSLKRKIIKQIVFDIRCRSINLSDSHQKSHLVQSHEKGLRVRVDKSIDFRVNCNIEELKVLVSNQQFKFTNNTKRGHQGAEFKEKVSRDFIDESTKFIIFCQQNRASHFAIRKTHQYGLQNFSIASSAQKSEKMPLKMNNQIMNIKKRTTSFSTLVFPSANNFF